MEGRTATRVVNLKHEPYDVYIGRANPRYGLKRSILASPFKVGKDGTREEILSRYASEVFYPRIESDPAFREYVESLRGKRLGCWCKPLPCHGDIIVEYLEKQDG